MHSTYLRTSVADEATSLALLISTNREFPCLNKMAAAAGDPRVLKEEGNKLFKSGKYAEAASKYTEAIDKSSSGGSASDEMVILRRNRAACFLKTKQYDEAISDCLRALEVSPSDVKAMYRLAQAQEGQEKSQEAFGTLKKLMTIDPKNAEVQQFARRLTTKLKMEVERLSSTDGLVSEMSSVLISKDTPSEKKIQAAKNLAILSREAAGAERILRGEGLSLLFGLLSDSTPDVVTHCIQTLVGVCQESKSRTVVVMNQLPLGLLSSLVDSPSKEAVATSVIELFKLMVIAVTEEAKEQKPSDPVSTDLSFGPSELSVIMPITKLLCEKIVNTAVSAETRDAILNYFVKTTARHDVNKVYLKEGVVVKLLQVAASTCNISRPTQPLPISVNTRLNVSVFLSELHKSLRRWVKAENEDYRSQCTSYILPLLQESDTASQIRGMTALCAILQGVVEVGNAIFSNEVVLQQMVVLAKSPDPQSQVVAAEALALAASDKDNCSAIMAEGLGILKDLYEAKDDGIRVRALVGLCKLGSTSGWNVSARTLPSGSMLELLQACRRFLVGPEEGSLLKKWSVEGIAFLSMNAEVKEALMKDQEAMKSLFGINNLTDQAFLFGLASIFVNLTNSYDKLEKTEEMEQLEKLGKYAGEQLPKEHEFDGDDYVKKRIQLLIAQNAIPMLVKMGQCDSDRVREQVARVLLAFTTDHTNRGVVVQQGGSKCLVSLALSSTATGKLIAAQALAKIGITADPRLAFPGQRMLEVVRPLCALLKSEKGLQQFEGLLALTNLASVSDEVRIRIVKEKGVREVESLMFEDHELIRRAATEAMCNLVMCEQVAERFLQDDVERVKLLTLFSGEEDVLLAKAASGALCQLSADERICKKILDVKQAVDIFKEMIASDNEDLRFRALFILANIVEASKELAERVIADDDLMTIFNGFVQADIASDKVRECAQRTLSMAVQHGLIQPTKACASDSTMMQI